jgi:hypothetical protein
MRDRHDEKLALALDAIDAILIELVSKGTLQNMTLRDVALRIQELRELSAARDEMAERKGRTDA